MIVFILKHPFLTPMIVTYLPVASKLDAVIVSGVAIPRTFVFTALYLAAFSS